MSTPPIVDLPNKCAASVVMSLQHIVAATESPFTYNEQTFKWPGTRWKMDIIFPPITNEDEADELKVFFLKLQGIHGRFLMGDPSRMQPRGSAIGAPVISGVGQQGNAVVTSGWTPDQNGALVAGDYIQLGNGTSSQYHMVVEVVNSNASGQASIRIEPPLRFSPQDGSPVIVRNARGVFRVTSNEPSWSVSPGKVYRFSFSAQEVINA